MVWNLNMTKNYAYFISDGTGVTAAALGSSLLTQFKTIQFHKITMPFIDSVDKAEELLLEINQTCAQAGTKIFIFATIVNPDVLAVIKRSNAIVLDILNTFMQPIEDALGVKSSHDIGLTHGVDNYEQYHHRIDAVNFTLNTDDGLGMQTYDQADLILIGVSRCGKTPTSLYLALHFGLQVSNYPLHEDELESGSLPQMLKPFKKKLFGLTIEPERLHQVRQKRRPDSQYAKLNRCRHEVQGAEDIFIKASIPHLDTTHHSIEEIGAKIIAMMEFKH